jgi:hypothetical protein
MKHIQFTGAYRRDFTTVGRYTGRSYYIEQGKPTLMDDTDADQLLADDSERWQLVTQEKPSKGKA